MSSIRRQSIISTIVIYIGFAIGLLNTYFFTRQGARAFSPEEYGLTSIFIAIASMMMAFASLAMPSYIYKFYHYYNDHLPPRKNDMITWALLCTFAGFSLVVVAGWLMKSVVIRKFGANSPMLLTYYYWIFPMGFGLTVYTLLEAYTWNLRKPVLTNFLKEVQWRLLTTVIIVLFFMNVIRDFDLFIKLYAFTYPGIALTLLIYLVATKQIHFTFIVSKISRRYFRKIVTFCLFVYSSAAIFAISQVFDSLVIASVLDDGIAKAGIFGLAQIFTSVIQAPQRAIIAVSIPHIARAWKDKNQELLQRIYQRSSLNQLIFASGIYVLIALNYTEAVTTFNLKEEYLQGFTAFLILGLTRIVDMGTGLNSQIIVTSNYWRFELLCGMVLLVVMLPLTLILTRQYDIIGPAIANLISITLYNFIRVVFLWKKFNLFPFTIQSLYTLLLATGCWLVCYFLFRNIHGFGGHAIRSAVFIFLYGGLVIGLRLSSDVEPVIRTLRKRLGWRG